MLGLLEGTASWVRHPKCPTADCVVISATWAATTSVVREDPDSFRLSTFPLHIEPAAAFRNSAELATVSEASLRHLLLPLPKCQSERRQGRGSQVCKRRLGSCFTVRHRFRFIYFICRCEREHPLLVGPAAWLGYRGVSNGYAVISTRSHR